MKCTACKAPATRGRTSTRCTASRRPENSSHSAMSFCSTAATDTGTPCGAAPAAGDSACESCRPRAVPPTATAAARAPAVAHQRRRGEERSALFMVFSSVSFVQSCKGSESTAGRWTAAFAPLAKNAGKAMPSGTGARFQNLIGKQEATARPPAPAKGQKGVCGGDSGNQRISGVRRTPDIGWLQRTAGTLPALPRHRGIRAGRFPAAAQATSRLWQTHAA